MKSRLLTIPFSHYCEKARWAMDLSGLPYIEEKHVPVFHMAANRRFGAGRTVPALATEAGVLCDSTDILEYVHRHGVNLYPRRFQPEVRSWEDRFDETLGPYVRVWAYAHILTQPELLPDLLSSCPETEQALARPLLGLFALGLRRHYGVKPGHDREALREIEALWDQTDWLLSDGRSYLIGESFSAADLTLGALAGPMLLPPEYGFAYPPLARLPARMRDKILEMRETPTGRHVMTIYHKHRQLQPATALARRP